MAEPNTAGGGHEKLICQQCAASELSSPSASLLHRHEYYRRPSPIRRVCSGRLCRLCLPMREWGTGGGMHGKHRSRAAVRAADVPGTDVVAPHGQESSGLVAGWWFGLRPAAGHGSDYR